MVRHASHRHGDPAILPRQDPEAWRPRSELATATEIQLSSLDLTHVQQNEGKPGIDRSASDHPIRIAGRHFAHGFGTHSPSVLHLDLAGGCSRFTAQVGITGNERLVPKSASAEFVIEGDGKVLWCSPIMRGGMNAHPVTSTSQV